MGVIPALSDPDPEVAGEGSIDPLGLATFANRLANELAPDVTARMVRIRFVTAIAVGAVVTEDLVDEPPADGVSTPQICFEWVVLEAFVRKAAETGALQATGVPGSAKASSVILQGKRLGAANYLKGPSVFGFGGVYQPLAQGMRVVNGNRTAAERAAQLVEVWEQDQDFSGFLNRRPGSPGVGIRDRLREAVMGALRAGRCSATPSARLWVQIARSLAPLQAGTHERALLRFWLLDESRPVRQELARALAGRPLLDESALIEAILPHASQPLRECLDAITTYEHFSIRLDAALGALRHISTHQTQPVTPRVAGANPVIKQAAQELPDSFARMAAALEPFGLQVEVTASLGDFADQYEPAELVDRLLEHHRRIQQAKGKQEWFEALGAGVMVLPHYWQVDAVEINDSIFLHPFRISTLRRFMEDTQP